MGLSAPVRAWVVCVAAAIGSAGCGGSSATLLIEVVDSTSGASFDSLDVHVYDPYGVVGSAHVAAVLLPGALVAKHLPNRAQVVRVVVAGNVSGGKTVLATAKTMMVVGARATVVVDLATDEVDTDGDGVPDDVDDCPTIVDPNQHSSNGGAPGDACGGGGDMAVSADLAVGVAPNDGSMPGSGPDMVPPADMAGVLLYDDFLGTSIDTTIWSTDNVGGGKVTVGNGVATITAPTAALAWATLVSNATFPVGVTLTAKVHWNAGQTYDEKEVGFADLRISDICGEPAGKGGEAQAAMARGQDNLLLYETIAGAGAGAECQPFPNEAGSYVDGDHLFEVVRLSAGQVNFYDNGTMISDINYIPAGALPVRLGVFSSTDNAPQAPVTMTVDWVKVTQN
jgi:hypothetical protein